MYEVNLGGDTLLFGADDVVDYLSQYGHVHREDERNCFWLVHEPIPPGKRFSEYDRLWAWCDVEQVWHFEWLETNGRCKDDRDFGPNLDEAVAYYLEMKEKKCTK